MLTLNVQKLDSIIPRNQLLYFLRNPWVEQEPLVWQAVTMVSWEEWGY